VGEWSNEAANAITGTGIAGACCQYQKIEEVCKLAKHDLPVM
jgi:hypothetical protein